MRKTRSYRMIAIMLALLMTSGSLAVPGGVKAETSNNGWELIKGESSDLTTEAESPTDATLKNSVAAYYDQKIDVSEGTIISVDVSVPAYGTASEMLAYGFALVDRPGCFFNTNSAAKWLQAELVSNANAKEVLGIVRRQVTGSAEWLANLTPLSASRDTAEVYHITYEKIDRTEGGVNYSWKITMESTANKHSYMVPTAKIPHDLFAAGAYFAAGNRGAAATHTVKVANLTVTQPGGWVVLRGGTEDLRTEEENPLDATFTSGVSGYLNQKIEVQDGTRISVDVSVPVYGAATELLDYAFALVDRLGSFNTTDKEANSLMAEIVGLNNVTSVHGVVSKKLTGGDRAFLANLAPLSGTRNPQEFYHITYEKINRTEDGVNYSWKITMQSSGYLHSYLVKATDISQDMFDNGAYFAAGNRDGKTTHTVKVSNFKVVQPNEWGIIKGSSDKLAVDAENPAGATFTGDVCAFYNQKIDVQNGTKISVDVSVPVYGAAAELFNYAFALVDRPGSFYTSDNVANSLMAELASQANITTVYGMARKKLGADIKWLANLNPLSTSRNTAEVYHITYEKIDVTENEINYSWKITMKSSTNEHSYLVPITEISQNLFTDGAYFAAGRRDGSTSCTVKVANLTVTQPVATVLGDVNSDFAVDVCDLVRFKKYMADNNVSINPEAADCNEDGKVDEADLAELRKIILRGKL